MKSSPGATSSAQGRGGGRREGEGRRASSLLARSHGQRPTPPPPTRAAGGLASASGSPATAGGSPRQADFSRKERKLPCSGIMGRGLAPSPTTTGIRGESSAEGRKRPLPAPLPGGGGHRVATPERSHPLREASHHGGTGLSTPQDASRGPGGFKLPQRARPGTGTE